MVLENIHKWLGMLAVIFILMMMFSTVADVTGRYLLNSPIPGAVEVNRLLLVAAVCFALGFTQFRKQHIRIELVLDRFPPMPRRVAEGLVSLFALVLMALLTYGTIVVAYESMIIGEYEGGVVDFPIWPSRIALAIGCLALTMQYVVEIIQTFRPSLKK